jgi:hypothetical protein
MRLSKRERDFLTTFVAVAQKMLEASATPAAQKRAGNKRTRRSSADVAQLKRHVNAALRRNMAVKQIADELGVTPAYIYQLMR